MATLNPSRSSTSTQRGLCCRQPPLGTTSEVEPAIESTDVVLVIWCRQGIGLGARGPMTLAVPAIDTMANNPAIPIVASL